jgi:ankyrin repeat protein
MSALLVAAAENYVKLIRILLDPTRNGPRCFVNVASTDGTTPLHLSVAKGHRKATQALLTFGADPNATNFFGETPLHFACQSSSDHCAESILSVDPLWRKGDSKRIIESVSIDTPRPPINLKDSNHQKVVVVEVKDYGLNLPLHYASGWIPNYSRKVADSKSAEVVGPLCVAEPSGQQAPGSSSSSSASSSARSSQKLSSSRKSSSGGAPNGSSDHPSTLFSATTSSTGLEDDSATYNTPRKDGSSKRHASQASVKPRALSIKLIERMLDLEMRHSRHPLFRKFAFSIVTPNRAGWTPMQIAEANQDTELMDLFRNYMPPEAEIPDDSEFLTIQLASDIHLECLAHDQPSGRKLARKLVSRSKAKYVALLGDIGIAVRPYYRDFLVRLSKKYTYVFVLFGNHEYYHSTTRQALAVIESVSQEFPNIIWLRAGHPFEVEGVKIIGDTLWSHISDDELEAVGSHLSDYRHIDIVEEGGVKRKLSVNDTLAWHKEQLSFIKEEIEKSRKKNQPVVVMTHHAPLIRLGVTNPGLWESAEAEINSAFCTDLSGLFGSPVAAWLYGHTHWNHHMVVQDTLIAANQGGYIFGEHPTLPTNYDPKFTVRVLKQLPQPHKWATSHTPSPSQS